MGRYNFKPSRVYQQATHLLETGPADYPSWYNTVGTIPPGEIITRTQPVRFRNVVTKKGLKKPSKMFLPQKIVYEEDRLRNEFYADHPWELARPRIILEQDGRDGEKRDWSRIEQRGKPLDGESVIQRQLWLSQNVPGMTLAKAYDQARKEFYALRHEEDIERRVAKEEALSTGAYFGKSRLEVSMGIEDQVFEEWKEWAMKEAETTEAQRNAVYTGLDMEDAETAIPAVEEPEDITEATPRV